MKKRADPQIARSLKQIATRILFKSWRQIFLPRFIQKDRGDAGLIDINLVDLTISVSYCIWPSPLS